MLDSEALTIADEAAKIPVPENAGEGVRRRFEALAHLAARVRQLTSDVKLGEMVSRNETLEAENKRLSKDWDVMDSAARRMRFDLFDIENAATAAAKKAKDPEYRSAFRLILTAAQKSRLGPAVPAKETT